MAQRSRDSYATDFSHVHYCLSISISRQVFYASSYNMHSLAFCYFDICLCTWFGYETQDDTWLLERCKQLYKYFIYIGRIWILFCSHFLLRHLYWFKYKFYFSVTKHSRSWNIGLRRIFYMVMKSSSTDEVTNSDATNFLNKGTHLFLCNCFNIDIWCGL